MTDKVFVQYGCGLSAPAGWINFDVSPRLYAERTPGLSLLFRILGYDLFPRNVRYGDIVKGLPLANSSVDGIYCSHVLEHIDRTGIEAALIKTYRLLKPGGIFRLVVPDLKWRAEEYLNQVKAGRQDAADIFMQSCFLGENDARGLGDKIRQLFGNSRHRWMYDKGLMRKLLAEKGFTNIRECELGDSDERKFSAVEAGDRFYEGRHKELALEARKPDK